MSEPLELILSASSISSYLSCEYRYYLASVLHLPGRQSMAMLMGTAVHAGAEALHKKLPAGATERSFGAEVGSVVPKDGESPEKGLAGALGLFETYRTNIVPLLGKPVLVEAAFGMRVDGTLVTGRIDFADTDVHDTKTTETPSKVRAEYHRLQLSIYRHGYRVLTGRWPGRLILDIVGLNRRWKQLVVGHDDQEMADDVGLTAAGILAGRFPPSGALSGACSRCPYSGVCSYAVLD